jgi:hypothetical protein
MEITGQLSYPLNSENARPFGILRVYLSCTEVTACAGDGTAVEAEAALTWKVVDETCKLPGVVIGDARLPGRHACEANSVLYDPKQFRVVPVLHVD